MPHLHVLLNSHSGTAGGFAADQLESALEERGFTATIDADGSVPLSERLGRARNVQCDILVAAGGDGTATALAEVAVEIGKPMTLLPLGTANLLARDLLIPLEMPAWLEALPDMVPRRIDVGRVNGRVFLHKVVIGFVPGIAAGREKIRGREGLLAQLGFLGYAARRILRARRFALEIERENEGPHIERVQAVAVANNAYDEAFGRFFARTKLDDGVLNLYVLHRVTLMAALRLAAGVFVGHWRDHAALDISPVSSVTIRSRRRQVKAMLDGEVMSLFNPLRFDILPRALEIYAPPVPITAEEEAEAQAAATEQTRPELELGG